MPQSKYDLLHYDGSGIVADVRERSLAVDIEIAAAVGISQEKVKNVRCSATLLAQIEMVPTWIRGLSSLGEAHGSGDMYYAFIRKVNKEMDLLAKVDLHKIQNEIKSFGIKLNAKVKINANKARKINNVAGGNGLVVLYFNAIRKFTQSAIMLADVSVISIITKQTNIELTIPAGSVLIIDMQNFTAYLDGKNVYKNVSGEWFAISRDTLSLLIDAASGSGLAGTMEYVERYL
jgi:hypothetical protein